MNYDWILWLILWLQDSPFQCVDAIFLDLVEPGISPGSVKLYAIRSISRRDAHGIWIYEEESQRGAVMGMPESPMMYRWRRWATHISWPVARYGGWSAFSGDIVVTHRGLRSGMPPGHVGAVAWSMCGNGLIVGYGIKYAEFSPSSFPWPTRPPACPGI